MAKAKGIGWEQAVLAKTTGERRYLETIGNGEEFYIIPMKLGYDEMQRIVRLTKIKVDPDKITEEDVKEVEKHIKEKVKDLQKKGGNIFEDTNIIELAKVAFIGGVYDHNFHEPVYVRNDDGSLARDEDGDLLAEEDENGKPKIKRSEWDNFLLEKILKRDFQILLEISTIVTEFNRSLKKKNSGKSETPQNGSTKK